MEQLLPQSVQIVLLALIVIAFALSRAAKANPHISWLQVFRLGELTEAQRRRFRRQQDRIAGVELILAALVIPMAYVALKVMLFTAFTRGETLLVGALSLLCFGLGVFILIRTR